MNLLTEYDEEAYIRIWRRDGIIQGKQEKAEVAATNMLKKKYPISDISDITGLPLEQILKLQNKPTAQA